MGRSNQHLTERSNQRRNRTGRWMCIKHTGGPGALPSVVLRCKCLRRPIPCDPTPVWGPMCGLYTSSIGLVPLLSATAVVIVFYTHRNHRSFKTIWNALLVCHTSKRWEQAIIVCYQEPQERALDSLSERGGSPAVSVTFEFDVPDPAWIVLIIRVDCADDSHGLC